MSLTVDLFLLETWQRFQSFCFHLARAEFGYAVPLAHSWDGGRDVLAVLHVPNGTAKMLALQCKFTKSCGSDTRRSILKSLTAVDKLPIRPEKWILCIPVDPTGKLFDWFQRETAQRDLPSEVWGRSELLTRLEKRPDIFHIFFYGLFSELQSAFAIDDLELRRLRLDSRCQWAQPDRSVLSFGTRGTGSPDLLLDIIVRNRGNLDAALMKIVAEVGDSLPVPHGFPQPGLLFPKITYAVSLGHGKSGRYEHECEPPLVIRAGANERFKIRLTDTGYSWTGVVQLGLDYGERLLPLPCLRLSS